MKNIFLLLFLGLSNCVIGQIISGPMLGHIELRTAKIWVEVVPGSNLNCWVWEKKLMNTATKALREINAAYGFETNIFHAVNLKYGTTYQYQFDFNANLKKPTQADGEFTTIDYWQYRKQVPAVNFLAGSCNYIADTDYDRMYSDMAKLDKLAKPYGGDASIFETMSMEKSDFMLWLGDNWYTREADYQSPWGLNARPSYDRKNGSIQKLMKAMPNYAIWDDHDFGPNDCDKSYVFSDESRNVFKRFWANPSYGDGQEGVYTKFSVGDVDVFMLDDRTWRSNDNMNDSTDGAPNPEKKMFGAEQIDWLKNQLVGSNANFKIIASGSQMLNRTSPYDCFRKFPIEFNELMKFLSDEKINGVLFMTGDRHHTEIIVQDRPGLYPLYDVTISPLTSGTHSFGGAEKDSQMRVLGIDQKQNYGQISVSGPLNDRTLRIDFKGIRGESLATWSIHSKALRNTK